MTSKIGRREEYAAVKPVTFLMVSHVACHVRFTLLAAAHVALTAKVFAVAVVTAGVARTVAGLGDRASEDVLWGNQRVNGRRKLAPDPATAVRRAAGLVADAFEIWACQTTTGAVVVNGSDRLHGY
jgi:hypothetical protein